MACESIRVRILALEQIRAVRMPATRFTDALLEPWGPHALAQRDGNPVQPRVRLPRTANQTACLERHAKAANYPQRSDCLHLLPDLPKSSWQLDLKEEVDLSSWTTSREDRPVLTNPSVICRSGQQLIDGGSGHTSSKLTHLLLSSHAWYGLPWF